MFYEAQINLYLYGKGGLIDRQSTEDGEAAN